jgi:hypothetical protein
MIDLLAEALRLRIERLQIIGHGASRNYVNQL